MSDVRNLSLRHYLGEGHELGLIPDNGRHEAALLLARRAGNDAQAALEVVAEVLPRIRRLVHTLVGSDPHAEDLVQEAVVQVLQGLPSYRGESSLANWALGLTYRVAMRKLKRLRREPIVSPSLAELTHTPAANPERAFTEAALRSALQAHLGQLSAEQRLTLLLRVVEGQSVQSVAALTGAKVNTVRGRIRSGLRALRKSIAADAVFSHHLGERRHDPS